jgi:hypothetical protein
MNISPEKTKTRTWAWMAFGIIGTLLLVVLCQKINQSGKNKDSVANNFKPRTATTKPITLPKGIFDTKKAQPYESESRPSLTTTLPPEEKALSLVKWNTKIAAYGGRYIVGIVKNNSSKEYSYVEIDFNLYDKDGNQVGSSLANINNLEPYGKWKFEAIILEDNATRIRLKGISGW